MSSRGDDARSDHGRRCLAALMPAGAFAVHQLRYMLAFGSRAGMELARQGHCVPALARAVDRATRASRRRVPAAGLDGRSAVRRSIPRYTLSFAALWMVCAPPAWWRCTSPRSSSRACSRPGIPAGLAGIFGYGGWWSIPAAFCVGLVLAAIFHGARLGARGGSRAQRGKTVAGDAGLRSAPHPPDVLLPRARAAGRGLVGTRASCLMRIPLSQ